MEPFSHDSGDETGRVRLLQELKRLSGEPERRGEVCWTPIGEVSRNADGQSLDDARQEFRAAWQAKVADQRQRAAWARKRSTALRHMTRQLRTTGLLIGAVAGLLYCFGDQPVLRVLHGSFVGAMLGLVAVIPLMLLTEGSAGHWRERAEQLERAARQMEQL